VRQNVKHLREHGPCTNEDLPHSPNLQDKKQGVARLRFTKNSGIGSGNSYGTLTPVYYLLDEHEEEDVVEKFLDANPRFADAEERDIVRMVGRMGPSWRDAAREVVA